MEGVSLYDKYNSEHNKQHMYKLITNIINNTYKIDISKNSTYNQFFDINFKNTFKIIESEDIKDFNKHLLETQIDYYKRFISKQSNIDYNNDKLNDNIDKSNDINKSNDIDKSNDINKSNGDLIIYSLKRIINLQNSSRYNYNYKNELINNCQIEKIIIPIEDNSLFMSPILLINIDNNTIELHIRGTIKLGLREYGIYTPFYEKPFNLKSNKTKIQLKNQLYNFNNKCDIFKIKEYNNNKIIIEVGENFEEFKEGDYIRIYNFDKIELNDDKFLHNQYKLKYINQDNNNLELKIIKDIPIKSGLYIMNISLQHSIHLTY